MKLYQIITIKHCDQVGLKRGDPLDGLQRHFWKEDICDRLLKFLFTDGEFQTKVLLHKDNPNGKKCN